MIVSDFLPRDDALFAITDPVELTESVDDLALSYPDGWPEAYWFGWMHWDNVPDSVKLSTVKLEGSGFDLTVKADYGSPRNVNIGYMAAGMQGNAINWFINPYGTRGFIDNSGVYLDPVSDVPPQFGSRFINSLDPRGVCPIHGGASNFGYHAFGFVFQVQRVYNGDERDGYNNFSFFDFDNFTGTNGDAIEEFLNGDYSINLSATGYTLWDNTPSVSYYCNFNFDLNINDTAHFGVEHPNTWTFRFIYNGVDHILNVFMCGFGLPAGADATGENTGYTNNSYRVMPVISQSVEGVDYKSIGSANYYNFVKFDGTSSLVNYDSGIVHNNFYFNDYCYGGFNGNVVIKDNGQNCYGISFDDDANYAAILERQSPILKYVWCFRILSPDEIRHTMCLNMRYVINDDYTQYSYGFGSGIFVPHITEDNEFLGEWLTGDFADIRDELRPWQYGNITDDDYNPEDLPPYVPPRETAENVGDTISRPASLGIGGTNKFITQYSMTATQIAELGQVLWTSIFTTDYWKNFMFSLALDTGSINVSAILNFFISLRFYPFSIANLSSYTNAGQDMYIGSGMMPLHFSTDLFTIDEYADYIYGGDATIWTDNFYRDWRDYVNTEITLYIPYCGTVQLNPADVVGNKISVEYAVDFATGACIAYVDLKTGDGAGYPIAALPGQIGADIPLTATVAGQVAARIAGDAMNVAGLIGGSASNQLGSEIGAATGAMSGKAAPTAGSVGFALGGPLGAAAGFALGSAAGAAPGIAGTAINILQRGGVQAPMLGGARGFASFGAPQTPYVQIRRGIYPDIDNYKDVVGNPAPSTAIIAECNGLIKGDIITAGLAVQAEEAEAIRAAISNGIIV